MIDHDDDLTLGRLKGSFDITVTIPWDRFELFCQIVKDRIYKETSVDVNIDEIFRSQEVYEQFMESLQINLGVTDVARMDFPWVSAWYKAKYKEEIAEMANEHNKQQYHNYSLMMGMFNQKYLHRYSKIMLEEEMLVEEELEDFEEDIEKYIDDLDTM